MGGATVMALLAASCSGSSGSGTAAAGSAQAPAPATPAKLLRPLKPLTQPGGRCGAPHTKATLASRAGIAAIGLILAGVLAGCSSLTAGSPGASSTPSLASGASAPAAARTFSSRLYGYTVALLAGWSAQPGQRWGGIGPPGPVDIFRGQPYAAAWVFAVPRPASPAAYATAITQTAAQLPCPAALQTSQAVTIGGVPARLIGMRCPARDGVLMLTAVTTRGPSALVVTFEDSSGMSSAQHRPDRHVRRRRAAGR